LPPAAERQRPSRHPELERTQHAVLQRHGDLPGASPPPRGDLPESTIAAGRREC
jgi:hypothetical protein